MTDKVLAEDPEKAAEGTDQLPAVSDDALPHPRGNLVEFDGPDDPANPQNWSRRRKVAITAALGGLTFVVTIASSIFSVAVTPVARQYGVSELEATLGTSLFLLGFVFGPIIFGPGSEVWGRRIPLLIGYAAFAAFQVQVAVGQSFATIMVGRFLGGFSASAPLAVIGGAFADMWGPIERAYAVCVFATAGFSGPVAGPVAGGFMVQSSLGWRWTAWLTLIMAGFFGLVGLVTIPETSAPRILQMKAKRLRKQTENSALYAQADKRTINAKTITTVYLVRPFVMFVQEPILALVTLYMSLIYGILYLLFGVYPIAFEELRGWSTGVGSLPFLAFIVGIALGTAGIAYSTRTNFTRAFKKHGRVIPEERLPPMIVGGAILPCAMFLFGWTSNPNITWVPQVIATALLGGGCIMAFWQGMNYMIDCYGFYSNSAIAINTFVRSLAAAGFPFLAPTMYRSLGVPWATSLLAFLTLAFFPVPILFYKYGSKIRAKSRFNPAIH